MIRQPAFIFNAERSVAVNRTQRRRPPLGRIQPDNIISGSRGFQPAHLHIGAETIMFRLFLICYI